MLFQINISNSYWLIDLTTESLMETDGLEIKEPFQKSYISKSNSVCNLVQPEYI